MEKFLVVYLRRIIDQLNHAIAVALLPIINLLNEIESDVDVLAEVKNET